MTSLRTALQAHLADWRNDLSADWRSALAQVEPDFTAVPADMPLAAGDVIFPLRKGHTDPRAPAGSHLFRALDGLKPSDVRCVLLGQDPYPRIDRATGRSFDQGGLASWNGEVAESLRRIIQTLVQHRQPDPKYRPHDDAWPETRQNIAAGSPAIEAPAALFDRWQAAGVLCLNRALTFSRFNETVQQAHMAMWDPVVSHIVRTLAGRPAKSLLVLTWGGKAQAAFSAMGAEAVAHAAGSRLLVQKRPHPAADGPEGDRGAAPFLRLEDPFTLANRDLQDAGLAAINW